MNMELWVLSSLEDTFYYLFTEEQVALCTDLELELCEAAGVIMDQLDEDDYVCLYTVSDVIDYVNINGVIITEEQEGVMY